MWTTCCRWAFFYTGEIRKKRNKKQKIRKEVIFGGFLVARSEKKREKSPDSYIKFSWCSQPYKRIIKDFSGFIARFS
jgi:hypothetical protein